MVHARKSCHLAAAVRKLHRFWSLCAAFAERASTTPCICITSSHGSCCIYIHTIHQTAAATHTLHYKVCIDHTAGHCHHQQDSLVQCLIGKWALQDQELAFRQPGRGECCHMQRRFRVRMWDRCHISMWNRGCCRHYFSVCCWCPQRLPSTGCQNCHSWQLNSIGCPDPRFSICCGGAFLSLTCTPSISLQQPDMIHKHVSLCASGTLPIFCKKPHEPAKCIAHIILCSDDSERQPAAPSMLQLAPSPVHKLGLPEAVTNTHIVCSSCKNWLPNICRAHKFNGM